MSGARLEIWTPGFTIVKTPRKKHIHALIISNVQSCTTELHQRKKKSRPTITSRRHFPIQCHIFSCFQYSTVVIQKVIPKPSASINGEAGYYAVTMQFYRISCYSNASLLFIHHQSTPANCRWHAQLGRDVFKPFSVTFFFSFFVFFCSTYNGLQTCRRGY